MSLFSILESVLSNQNFLIDFQSNPSEKKYCKNAKKKITILYILFLEPFNLNPSTSQNFDPIWFPH